MRPAALVLICVCLLLPACTYTVTDENGQRKQVSRSEYDSLRKHHPNARDHYRGGFGTTPAPTP